MRTHQLVHDVLESGARLPQRATVSIIVEPVRPDRSISSSSSPTGAEHDSPGDRSLAASLPDLTVLGSRRPTRS
ncbi:hypothetical protein BFN03_19870 [Rhodococcus sp. WMMA185]|nr:hypothetical protein BFN03_19870 [Rhodococcus sp. WMMA185]